MSAQWKISECRFLGLVEAQHFTEQDRPETGDGRAHRDTDSVRSQRQELDWHPSGSPRIVARLDCARLHLLARIPPRLRQTREIALDVGHHNRHTRGGQLLGDACNVLVLPVPVAPAIRP